MIFQHGEYTLASGKKSSFKIDVDHLTDSDIETCAYLLNYAVNLDFSDVYGVPTGGLRLSEAMKKYCTYSSKNVLVVDDVWTSGRSMMKFINNSDIKAPTQILRAVIFMRGPAPSYIYRLFEMPAIFWNK